MKHISEVLEKILEELKNKSEENTYYQLINGEFTEL